jgi:hypothetical protein
LVSGQYPGSFVAGENRTSDGFAQKKNFGQRAGSGCSNSGFGMASEMLATQDIIQSPFNIHR